MAARWFDSIASSAAAAINAVAGQMLYIDGATAAADVVVTMPAGTLVGQACGFELTTADDVHAVTFAGPVTATLLPPLVAPGDWVAFTWDGTNWRIVGYDTSPAWFDIIAGSTVGLYRLNSPTSFVTDYSGNGRNLAAAGTVTASPGYTVRGSCKSTGAIGQQANAAFQLQAAMSALVFCNVRVNATVNQNFLSCGLAGATAATNLQYSLGTGAGGIWQYFHETGAGVDVVFAPASSSPIGIGWQVLGFTRSAAGVVKFYGNGALIATSAALGAPTGGASSQLAIGAFQGGTFACNADIVQVAVYSAELTAAQVKRQTQLVYGAHS